MKIVADRNIPEVERAFASIGKVELGEGRALTSEQIADADILLTRSVTEVNAALLNNSSVRFVGSATSGRDHIDQQFLAQSGIGFAHAPGCNARSVVEYVLAAISQTRQHLETLLDGGYFGIVGYGHVGRALVLLCDALAIKCRVYDPWLEQVPYATSLEQVLASDVVSLHCELTQDAPWPSHRLLGERELNLLRAGTLLINASRGSVIDNNALSVRLAQRADIDVVLDVWEGEPAINQRLLSQVTIGTPHIAGYSHDGKLSATYHLAAEAIEFFELEAIALSDASKVLLAIDLLTDCSRARAIRTMIGSRYAIAEDDSRLREGSLDNEPADAANYFDQLRKNYPIRRELWGSSVHYGGADQAILSAIQALGCTVREASKE